MGEPAVFTLVAYAGGVDPLARELFGDVTEATMDFAPAAIAGHEVLAQLVFEVMAYRGRPGAAHMLST